MTKTRSTNPDKILKTIIRKSSSGEIIIKSKHRREPNVTITPKRDGHNVIFVITTDGATYPSRYEGHSAIVVCRGTYGFTTVRTPQKLQFGHHRK